MLEKNKVLAKMKKQNVRFLKNLFGTFYQAWTTYFWRVLTFIEALRQTTLSIIACVLFAFSHFFFHPLHIYFYTILPLFSIWRTSVQCSQQGYVLKKGNEWHIYFWNPNSYVLYFEEIQQKNSKNFLLHFLLNFLNHKMLEWQFQKKINIFGRLLPSLYLFYTITLLIYNFLCTHSTHVKNSFI